VRNYEGNLSACRILMRDILDPAGVRHITAEVADIDV
jgi:NADH dehydrogenase